MRLVRPDTRRSVPSSSSFCCWRALTLITLSLAMAATLPTWAQEQRRPLREVRAIRAAKRGFPTPTGLAYSPRADAFLTLRALPQAGSSGSEVNWITMRGEARGLVRLPAVKNALNLTFDAKRPRLLILDSQKRELVAIPAGADASLAPQREVHFRVEHFGVVDPQGLAVDPASGRLFVLDREGPWLLRVDPDEQGDFDAAAVSRVDFGRVDLSDLRGFAYDRTTGHLHVLTGPKWTLSELTEEGELVATRDLSGSGLFDPRGIVFAPSGDMTDEPAKESLYVADAGRRGSQASASAAAGASAATAAAPQTGGIVELTFAAVAAAPLATFVSSVVVETLTSQWSPPAPDTSDVAFLPAATGDPRLGTLLVVDSEVDEMSIWRGANKWEASLNGATVLGTADLRSLTREPTGISVNPTNRHLFISDDDQKRVYEINPGPDKIHHTSDDIVRSFSVSSFSGDAEDVTYDPLQNVLFLADGVNNEVYRLTPGANGIFDGVPPSGDDQMTHFDTSAYVSDPEALTINTDTGNLYIAGKPDTQAIEITTSGVFVRTIDISAANAKKTAGLGYGPGSSQPAARRLYVVQRGVDNNSDPNENDGKLWEMTLPGNQPPFVDAGPDQLLNQPAAAALDGTVLDDGQPTPPSLTTSWTKFSGPGTVGFGNASAVDTTAAFGAAGTYVLRLTANDGALEASDDIVVTVNVAGNQPPGVNAGVDQIVTLPDSAALDGTVIDDGVSGQLTTTWTMLNGPGNVTFGNAAAVDTTASFSSAGLYTLRLTADDGIFSVSDDAVITVYNPGGAITFEKRVAASSDDAEQGLSNGSVSLTSSDLELTLDQTTNQAVGMRFTGVAIPPGAAIVNAWVQFKVDETGSSATSLTFRGQAADNPPTFTSSANNITSRPVTVASVSWAPASWTVVGQIGPAQQTPNLAPVIQEIVSRPGWLSGNALVLVVTGSGARVAEAVDGDAPGAPLLHVEYSGGGGQTFTLSVTKSGTGTGTVTSTPTGIDCGATCSAPFNSNTVVSLSQTASTGSVFTGWGGACSGTGACQVTMSSARSVTATFSPQPTHTLTVTKSGTGTGTVTSTPAGIDCGSTCSAPFNPNAVVSLSQTASTGSVFAGWGGGACSGTGACQVTMSSAQSVTAAFDPQPTHTLTVTKSGTGAGTVTSTPAGIDCGGTCSAPFNANAVVSLSQTASTGSVFAGWGGGACSGTGACQVTMDAAKSVTATFDPQPTHTLTVTKNGTGTGTVTSTPAGIDCGASCSAPFNANAVVSLSQTASAGSVFAGWGGGLCSGTGACQVTMDAAQSVTATFIQTFTLSVTKNGTGAGTVTSTPAGINCGANCSAPFNSSALVSLSQTADTGSVFAGWGGACSGNGACQVTMNAAQSVTATFTQTFTLTVTKNGTGTGTVSSTPAGINCGTTCSAPFNANAVVSLSQTAGSGSVFTAWSGACSGTGACQVTMNAALSVTATFSLSGGTTTTFEKRVLASSDDAEQNLSNGSVNLTSTDLEMTIDGNANQAVGMRFTAVTIPQGAAITSAWVQFKTDTSATVATSVNIQGQAADNSLTFTTAVNNVTSRPRTVASVNWVPPAWTSAGQAGPAQQTPSLTSVIQEIVSRPGWVSGNSLVLIVTGTGTRRAESFNGDAPGAPLLHVEYSN